MKKIEIVDEKILSLSNVIYTEFHYVKMEDLPLYISKFLNLVNKYKIKFIGPIILNYKKSENDLSLRIMIQCDNYQELTNHFEIIHEFKSKKCIYSHYSGNLDELMFVWKKMDVYAYENDILLDTEIYLAILSFNEHDEYIIDVFKQYMIL